MFRNIFAIFAGVFAMVIAITFVEMIDIKLFPIPTGLDADNPADLATIMAAMPLAAKALIVFGWCLGAFVGAAVAARISDYRLFSALLVGALVVIGTLMNSREVPHPQWMILAGTLLPLPLAWLATRMMPARQPTAPPVKRWQGNEHER